MSPHPLVRTGEFTTWLGYPIDDDVPVADEVLGSLPPHDLGMTLCHEHMSMIFDVAFCDPDPSTEHMSQCPLTVENLGWIRQHPYSHRQNLRLEGNEVEEAVLDDLRSFKACGGR
ncbi:unnamed protein product, partial [Cyprideis torosa]